MKKNLYTLGILTFLLALSAINPVMATEWGSPLATDSSGDGEDPGEDIQSVDARYFNEFVYFRFQLYEPFYSGNIYLTYIDFDKNTSSGDTSASESDVGYEFTIECDISNNIVSLFLDFHGGSSYSVDYNITTGYTQIAWSPDPSVGSNFDLALVMNSSQGEVVYGVNWTWIVQEMALLGVEGDNCSMYLEFEAGSASDWCPNRTTGATDYIEWDLCTDTRGIPGFSISFALLSLLTFLGVILLMHRNRMKF